MNYKQKEKNYFFDKQKEKIISSYKYQNSKYFKFIKIYEEVLDIVSSKLNKFHNKKYSKSFWRINLGPYLLQLVGTFYFIYEINKSRIKYVKIKNIYIDKNEGFINTKSTFNFFTRDEGFEYLNSKLKQNLIKKKINLRKIRIKNFQNKINQRNQIKLKLFNFFSNLISFYKKDNGTVYLGDNFLGFKRIIKYILFGKFKYFFFDKKLLFNYKKKFYERQKIFKISDKNLFKNTLMDIISDTLPMNYFETFNIFINEIKKKNIYNKKNYYLSSNSIFSNDSFKLMVSLKSKESQNILFQHGGHYFIKKYHFSFNHEKLII